jgi:hypothetical protein
MKLDFNDLLIVPKEVTDINTRSIIDPFVNGRLPLITAPMDTVLSEANLSLFRDNKIQICQPRCLKVQSGFKAYSIQQMRDLYLSNQLTPSKYLIDVANGHMDSVLHLTKEIKKNIPNLTLMVGNIANPESYRLLSEAGADYIRAGIGNGGGCLLENSVITTNLGDKLIQDVEIGDYVLTHTGEFKEVLSVIAYPSREELIKINDTISTKTHEYYVLSKKYEDLVNDDNIHDYAEWIKAENLTNEYFLLEYVVND